MMDLEVTDKSLKAPLGAFFIFGDLPVPYGKECSVRFCQTVLRGVQTFQRLWTP